jgi:hypothetical protein
MIGRQLDRSIAGSMIGGTDDGMGMDHTAYTPIRPYHHHPSMVLVSCSTATHQALRAGGPGILGGWVDDERWRSKASQLVVARCIELEPGSGRRWSRKAHTHGRAWRPAPPVVAEPGPDHISFGSSVAVGS